MSVRILVGDVRNTLASVPDCSVQCCVTSPPYWGLRDYGHGDQIGLESTPEQFVASMVQVFGEVRRVLRDDGVLWLNLGDSYNAYNGNRGESGGLLEGRRNAVVGTPKLPRGSGLRVKNQKSKQATNAAADFDAPHRSSVGKAKDLVGIPWRVALALQADGWYLRQDIIWHKLAPMPESVRDRCTKAHEYIFLLTKNARYFYDADAIAEAAQYFGPNGAAKSAKAETLGHGPLRFGKQPGKNSRIHVARTSNGAAPQKRDQFESGYTRNARSVWTLGPQRFDEAHFATFPPALPERCIKAGSKPGDMILDPFGGAGTTGLVAQRLQRDCILCELNPDYAAMAERRIRNDSPMFSNVTLEAA